jgi:hypothetical protein
MNIQEEGISTRKLSPAVSARLAGSKLFVLIAVIATCGAFGADLLRPKQTYYVDGPDKSMEVFPLTEPNVTSASLVNWITQAITSAYTIDFYHYQDTINGLKQYFTVDGYQNFLNALNSSGSLNKIINEKLIVSAVAINSAVILSEGMMNNVYTWKIQLPLLLTYQGASPTSTQKTVAVSVLVTRVPTNQAPKGIGIAQIIDEDYHASS